MRLGGDGNRTAIVGGAVAALLLAIGCGDSARPADGTETLLTDVGLVFLTVDDLNLYWSETKQAEYGGPIKRVRKGAVAPIEAETLGDGYMPVALGGSVYATTSTITSLSLTKYAASGQASALGAFEGFGSRMTADANNVYFSAFDFSTSMARIWTQPADGSPAVFLVEDGHGQPYEMVAVDGEVYWISDPTRASVAYPEGTLGVITKVALVGGAPTTAFEGPTDVTTLAADAGHLYFAADKSSGSVVSIDQTLFRLDRQSGELAPLTDTKGATSLVVQGGYLYWADRLGEGVRRIPVDGGEAVTLAKMAGVNSVAVDSEFVYWATWIGPAESPKGSLMRMPRPADDR